MDKVWKKVLWLISAFGLAISFLCCSSVDVSAENNVAMLVCGDSKTESREAFETLYRRLMGEQGLGSLKRPGSNYCMGVRGWLDMDNMSADLSATLDMYPVHDLKTIPELLFPSDLVVLVYAGKEAEGLGNLPQLQKELKSSKHRGTLPEIVLLRLNELLTSSYDDEQSVRGCAFKLIKACGNMWPRRSIEAEDWANDHGCID
jgi:hypothetical protein